MSGQGKQTEVDMEEKKKFRGREARNRLREKEIAPYFGSLTSKVIDIVTDTVINVFVYQCVFELKLKHC